MNSLIEELNIAVLFAQELKMKSDQYLKFKLSLVKSQEGENENK